MNRIIRYIAQFVLGLAIAATAVDAQAQMALKGKLLFQDDFKTPADYKSTPQPLGDGWSVQIAHADWKRTNGGVQSLFKSGHMPVLQFNCDHVFSNVVIEVDFRFHKEPGTNKGAACRISPTNPALNRNAYSASVWANQDSKDRAPGMVLEHDEWKPGGIITVDHKAVELKSGKWYRVRMELIGNAALANCNGVTVYGTEEHFGLPKTTVALGAGYCVHDFRRFRIYEARSNPKWTSPVAEKAIPAAKAGTSSGK